MNLTRVLRSLSLSLSRRRRHPRAPAAMTVDWHLFGSALHHRSSTFDLSAGGAMVGCVQPVPAGSPLVVAVATPEGRRELHARVAWSAESRMGIRFTSPAPLLA